MNVDQYNFSSKLKTSLIIMMAIGVVSLGINWMMGSDAHTRFWSNLLLNATFFLGIAFTAVFFMSGSIVALGGWMTSFKRVWEAFSMYLPIAGLTMLILAFGVYFNWHELYHWNDLQSVENDPILTHKSAFLNKNFYLFGTIIVIGIWSFFAIRIRKLSLAEDANGGDKTWSLHKTIRITAAILLPIAGYSSAVVIWQWIMSVDAHWYSTLFAWYNTISWFDAMLALTILLIYYLKSKGFLNTVTTEHMHDLGKYLFAFSIFWTYLWFSQYMLIWYSNNGEETGYFLLRMNEYTVLHYGILIINFLIPFFVLMRNDNKRKKGTMIIVSILVFVGHWLDCFLMIKPGVLHTSHELANQGADTGHGDHGAEAVGHAVNHAQTFVDGFHFPGFTDLGVMIGFLGLFLFVVLSSLSKAKTIPPNDPYYEETLHHHS